MTIAAKVICDSIANGIRLTTLELYYPRFIHSQFMTHRMFSRNASSSRAIPVQRNIDAVLADPATPIHWGKNQKGMQANEECDSLVDGMTASEAWKVVAEFNAEAANMFSNVGYHKQIVNRLLEPFAHIKVIVTATEWEGFFKLRLHDDAQPEIQELARCMKETMDNYEPMELSVGQWHLPYVDYAGIDEGALKDYIKSSVARCARVSYLNHDNSYPDIEKDIELADKLLAARHMSPFEHIATPMLHAAGYQEYEKGMTHTDVYGLRWSGNFRGWIQYRQRVGANHA